MVPDEESGIELLGKILDEMCKGDRRHFELKVLQFDCLVEDGLNILLHMYEVFDFVGDLKSEVKLSLVDGETDLLPHYAQELYN